MGDRSTTPLILLPHLTAAASAKKIMSQWISSILTVRRVDGWKTDDLYDTGLLNDTTAHLSYEIRPLHYGRFAFVLGDRNYSAEANGNDSDRPLCDNPGPWEAFTPISLDDLRQTHQLHIQLRIARLLASGRRLQNLLRKEVRLNCTSAAPTHYFEVSLILTL